jgi:valyl-tRNA synthetase
MSKTPGSYNHREIEKRWQAFWLKNKTYKWNDACSREENYVIDTPPPTVSGLLHMGHIYSYTQTDIIARFQRMLGKNVFYPMGFDDNGLPTERLVEKVKAIRPHNMDRQEFRRICHQVVDEAEEQFFELFNSIALSVDWDQKYQTISSETQKISQMSFLDLFHKNQAYRAMEPVLWDPVDVTALAQADVEDKESKGFMSDIVFHTEEYEKLIIATTRPELIPACVAVLYNPNDSRYKNLNGKKAITPIFNMAVPIIEDESVEIEKGTGLVMCCTFGDVLDIEWWRKYSLPLKVIIDKYGKVRLQDKEIIFKQDKEIISVIEQVEGLKAEKAREIMIEILNSKGFLVRKVEVIKNVKCAERSKSPLEILVIPQWFIKLLDKKDQLKQKSNECAWFPEYMKVRLENWIDGLSWDWCISRQRYFGIPFPVWYSKRQGEEGKVIVADLDQLPVDPLQSLPKGYSKEEVEPDIDVMDTWATSSISPQINSHAITKEYAIDYDRHKKLYPADLRPQAHEIIRTWTFYTIAQSLLHEDSIPWKNIAISGWCLAEDKTKMSKSKGNVITPTTLIEEKGADIVRYWASTSKLGADIVYSEKFFDVGKRLVNKIWNATKFVSLHLEDFDHRNVNLNLVTYSIDKWLILKLNDVIKQMTESLKENEYAEARRVLEGFLWKDFCDNYLEIIKVRAYNQDGTDNIGQASAKNTLSYIMEILLRLFSPFLPHITEELYYILFPEYHNKGSIHRRGNWPEAIKELNIEDYECGELFVSILDVVRRVKSEKQLSMKYPIENIGIILNDLKKVAIKENLLQDLKNVSNASYISFKNDDSNNNLENIYFSENNELKLIIKFSDNAKN